MTFGVWLRLGRVSNLPTVWTNVLAALAAAGTLDIGGHVLALWGSLSAFYVGGMYLNDAFDRDIDARERPGRPIPSGQVSARAVFALGFVMLAVGVACNTLVAVSLGAGALGAALSAALLAGLIVAYDAYHKQNPLSPLLMGACRVFVYVSTAYASLGALPHAVIWAAVVLWCYLIGLTYAAKQEAFNRLTRVWPLAFLAAPLLYGAFVMGRAPWALAFVALWAGWVLYALRFLRPGPRRAVPQAVVRLIAGIALLDAVFIAAAGSLGWALLAVAACALTRLFQRVIPGT